jgi:hypothetical protein
MTYLICKNDIKSKEIEERQKYIYDVFHIYTFVDTKNSNKNIVVLKSMPDNMIDLFFIIGHNNFTDNYLIENYNKIKEKNILIIACYTKYFSSIKLLKDKIVYIPMNGNIVKTYNGNDYGFNFEVTDEEIRMYRRRKENLNEMLNTIFKRK